MNISNSPSTPVVYLDNTALNLTSTHVWAWRDYFTLRFSVYGGNNRVKIMESDVRPTDTSHSAAGEL